MDENTYLKEKIAWLEQTIELQKQLLAAKGASYPVYVPYPSYPYVYPDPWKPYTGPTWTACDSSTTDTPTIISTTVRGGHNA